MSMAEDFEYDIPDYLHGDYNCPDFKLLEYKSIIHQTNEAYLINFGDIEAWVPISQVGHRTNNTIEICRYFKITGQPSVEAMFDEI